MGVQMLFYPFEYMGIDIKRFDDNHAPYGIFGWQGVVPARTEKMALRLVEIVTRDLITIKEIFGHLDSDTFANMLFDPVLESITKECGQYWGMILKPVLPFILRKVTQELQKDIEDVLDLPKVVLNAFVRDKIVLVELFQKVGRVELDFLIKSGFGFGFLMGLGQMILWVVRPSPWTLPVAGSLVGYVTNWIAIKLLFEPADPVDILGLFTIQGLFESRQVEVSNEFAHFMESRVLTSPLLLHALTHENEKELFQFIRNLLPYPIPEKVVRGAIEGIRNVALHPEEYKDIHEYMKEKLDIEKTLAVRLKKLSSKNFENLLHPVFQEDEIILIVTGGVLGAIAGLLQIRVIFDGAFAKYKSLALLTTSLVASAGFFFLSEYGDVVGTVDKKGVDGGEYDAVIDHVPSTLRRRNTVVRSKIDD